MTELQQNSAQNKLGELFIEFGTKGLPSLIKELNSVSATFLLTKNAAEQLYKPMKEMFKEAGNGAVGVGKLSAVLGASFKDVQKLQNYFKEINLDESLLNDIPKMQATIYDLKHGFGGLDGQMNYAFEQMGINIFDYNESLQSTLQLWEDIQTAAQNMSDTDLQANLRFMHISPEWSYAFKRGKFNKSDALSMSDEEANKLIKREEALRRKELALQNLKNTTAAFFAPIETNTADETARVIKGVKNKDPKIIGEATGVGLTTAGGAVAGGTFGAMSGAATGAALGAVLGPIGSAIGGILGGLSLGALGAWGGAKFGAKSGMSVLGVGKTLKESMGELTGFSAPIDFDMKNIATPIMPSPSLEFQSNLSDRYIASLVDRNITSSTTFNNEFHITGTNAQEIADKVVRVLDTQALEYNQFQLENTNN